MSSSAALFSSRLQSFPASGSNEPSLHIRWPEYWSFSISPPSEYSGLISFRIDWFDLLAVQGILKSLLQHYSSKPLILQHPWTATCQASLSITNSRSLTKLTSIELLMPSNHIILCRPLLLPPSIFPSIRVFYNESDLHIRWPKYRCLSFSISPCNEYSGLIFYRID